MKEIKGEFVQLDGEKFYKISNYDNMEDFFMTITSSSDVWNFCWSQGGITAGRINSDHAIFPYYTADKVSDLKSVTGSYTAVAVKTQNGTKIWEPFASLLANTNYKKDSSIERNIYKNENGTKVWFEELNKDLGLSFRYGWTSSAEFGLVKMSRIENLDSNKKEVTVFDGCRNIMPANMDAFTNNANSVLIDAYKKTEVEPKTNLTFFCMSSVLTDKAEPSEGLLANTSWFTTDDKIFLSQDNVCEFFENEGDISKLSYTGILKGERPGCFIAKKISLEKCEEWEQIFDTFLTAAKVAALINKISDKKNVRKELMEDIAKTDALMTSYISESDGIENTAAQMTCTHHRANVMFNIMRGGFFADNGKINAPDLIKFIGERNKAKVEDAKKILGDFATKNSLEKNELQKKFEEAGDVQLLRLFLEYMPIIFSRRHGDPSRPWNRFNIILNDNSGNPILNYEGNWRDIFQNWESLSLSYPSYIKNMVAKFLNAMTADGFNPYRISRDGVDWECPEPDNPWAQYGYWGDHQVIYLQKLLEMWANVDEASLLSGLDEILYSSSNIPYRLKSYKEICENPRNSIAFDDDLSNRLKKEAKECGSDKKLVQDANNEVALLSLTAKLMQIVICKAANLVPAGGIWMNTQRPEWNDANNALAGWGLSVVTTGYLNRMLKFLDKIYTSSNENEFTLPKAIAECFNQLGKLYTECDAAKIMSDDKARKDFTDKAGIIFEAERTELYSNGYNAGNTKISKADLLKTLEAIRKIVEATIRANKKENGLYHTYNTMVLDSDKMSVKNLQEMLEGQVSVLSAECLSSDEVVELMESLKKSAIYEPRQNSYILYPNKDLTPYIQKNNITADEVKPLAKLIERTGSRILEKDTNGVYHFNAEYKNARLMEDDVMTLAEKPSADELKCLLELYENKFCHQNFTGRSGTFYAYEGLGSIYWHMVSKLLLAVQEYALKAYETGDKNAAKLKDFYYDVRSGLSFNKTPELYGAFPSDPYSHTPFHKGARQPGMTGQVKEEILTRFGELGAGIKNGKAYFNPSILKEEEFFADGTLNFTWCNTKVTYKKTGKKSVEVVKASGNQTFEGCMIDEATTKMLFARNGSIKEIVVNL